MLPFVFVFLLFVLQAVFFQMRGESESENYTHSRERELFSSSQNREVQFEKKNKARRLSRFLSVPKYFIFLLLLALESSSSYKRARTVLIVKFFVCAFVNVFIFIISLVD